MRIRQRLVSLLLAGALLLPGLPAARALEPTPWPRPPAWPAPRSSTTKAAIKPRRLVGRHDPGTFDERNTKTPLQNRKVLRYKNFRKD